MLLGTKRCYMRSEIESISVSGHVFSFQCSFSNSIQVGPDFHGNSFIVSSFLAMMARK